MKTIEKSYFIEETNDKGIANAARVSALNEIVNANHEVAREHGQPPQVSDEITDDIFKPLKEIFGKVNQNTQLNLHLSKAAITGFTRVLTRGLLWRERFSQHICAGLPQLCNSARARLYRHTWY